MLLAFAGCGAPQEPGTNPPDMIFGRTGHGRLEFNYPRAAEFINDKLYVVDKGGRFQCVRADATYVTAWRAPQITAGKPTGLGIAPDGRVFAADTHYHRVLVFSPQGEELARFGEPGHGDGQFRLPTDVAIAANGDIYVSEYGGNDRISVYSPSFEFRFSFGNPGAEEGEFQRPQSIIFGAAGDLWVADAANHRICRFTPAGEFLAAFGTPGRGAGELWFPYSVDELSDGTLVVAEYGNNRVQRLTKNGESLGVWGAAGRRPGQLAYPWAAAVGPDDQVFVLDSGNNRVQVIAGRSRATWTRIDTAQDPPEPPPTDPAQPG